MRGLTSHARHIHGIEREDLIKLIRPKKDKTNMGWKIIGGVGALLVAIITVGRFK